LEKRLQHYQTLAYTELGSVARDHAELVELEGGAAHFFTHQVDLSVSETLLVVCAAVPTFWLPTYISLHGIGHLVAEGLIFSSNGGVREAPDEVMWEYR
jgi:hypothetical protein